MTAKLGINVDAFVDPQALAVTGCSWVRCVYHDNLDYRPWLITLAAVGIDMCFVGDSSPTSLSTAKSNWPAKMQRARDTYGYIVKIWQWMNEPDGTGMASWTMTPDEVNQGMLVARDTFPRPTYTLLTPGMVSGQASWMNNLWLNLVDGVDAHPYAKGCQTEDERRELDWMLNRYKDFGLPLWLNEYDSRTPGMSAYLRDFSGVSRAAVMCWDSRMTNSEGISLGLVQNPAAMKEFTAAARVQAPPPVVVPPHFELGFLKFKQAAPELLGEALDNEWWPLPGFSQLPTTTGMLTWSERYGHTFYHNATHRFYTFTEKPPAVKEVRRG